MDPIREGYVNQLKNKLFSLLCEFEENGDWEVFLDNIILELEGWEEKYKTINYYKLIYKLTMLRYVKYKYFRKIIFDCMNLLGEDSK